MAYRRVSRITPLRLVFLFWQEQNELWEQQHQLFLLSIWQRGPFEKSRLIQIFVKRGYTKTEACKQISEIENWLTRIAEVTPTKN